MCVYPDLFLLWLDDDALEAEPLVVPEADGAVRRRGGEQR